MDSEEKDIIFVTTVTGSLEMAHRYRGVSFNERISIGDYKEISEDEGDMGKEDIPLDDKIKLLVDNGRSRRYTEPTANEFHGRSNTGSFRSSSFMLASNDSTAKSELQASLLLSSLTLTTKSKVDAYLEHTRRRLSTYRSDGEATDISKSMLISFVEKLSTDRGASVLLAIWNLLPLLQGSAVFSMPYTIVQGGYLTLLLIPIISLMADVTGTILVDCLYEVSPRSQIKKRTRKDYADIARSVWGEHGARLLNVILMFYLFTGDVVNVVLLGKSIYDVLKPFTSLSFAALTAIFSILCYPTLFITRLTVLAYLSLLSIISVMIGIIAIMVVFIGESGNWSKHIGEISLFDVDGIPLAASIIMFSCLTHSVLPQVEGNMAESSKCKRAIHISYFSSAILKMLVAIFGAITFGVNTQSIVTLNVSQINTVARYVCAIALIGFSVFNYPLNMFVVCENIDSLIDNTKVITNNLLYYPWLIVTRLVLVILSIVVALVVPYFGLLLAIRGSLIGTCLIFIFPCYFHLKLKWYQLSNYERIRDIMLMLSGTIIGSLGLYSSIKALVLAIQKDYA